MSQYLINESTLTAIADAVREKSGTSEPIKVSELPTAIAAIEAGGGGEEYFTDEELAFTGSIANTFTYGPLTGKIVDQEKDRITFNNITDTSDAFGGAWPDNTLKNFTVNINNCRLGSPYSTSIRDMKECVRFVGTVGTGAATTCFPKYVSTDEIVASVAGIEVAPNVVEEGAETTSN